MQLAFNHFEFTGETNSAKNFPAGQADTGKQTILILHGLFGSKRNWQSIARKLSEHCQVFTLDLRNHGESNHSEAMRYHDMADDVFRFIADHCLGEISVIGHSLGGKVAMHMALENPEVIKRLVVIDIAPVQYQHGFDELINSLNSLPLDQLSSRQEADEFLRSDVQPESLRQFLLQNLQKMESGFSWRMNLEVIQSHLDDLTGFPVDQRNPDYHKPVLFLKGGNSDYIKHKHEKHIYTIFPRALFITVEGAGHWLHAENPDFVVKEIRQFIK